MESHQNEQQRKAEQRTKRFVVISFASHIAFLLSFTIGSYFAPQSLVLAPSVQIDMVALPDTLKNQQQEDIDLTKPVKEDTPPAPPPPEPEANKPEPVAEPTPPAQPDPDEMALEREKEKQKLLKDKKKLEADAKKRASEALKKMKEEAEKERLAEEKKRKDALEKRKKDLKDFEEAYRRAQRGNQKNEGTSATGDINADTKNAYVGHLVDRIRSQWSLPQYLQNKGYRAEMRMYLNARGEVFKLEFTRVSGNNRFDEQAEAAIRNAKFMPPPAEMASVLKNPGVLVQFPL